MLKKLRNKFLALNMTLTSVLLIAAFALVLAVSVSSADRELDSRIQRNIFAFGVGRGEGRRPDNFPGGVDAPPKDNEEEAERPEPIENISLRLGPSGEILEKRAQLDYDDEFYEYVAGAALTNIEKTDSRLIRTDSGYYKYRIFEGENELGETNYFLNLTNADAQISMLKNLALTLLAVLIAALLLVFLISLFFANRAIRPIEEAWDKQNRFIADASHELKTPLTTINTNVDVLLAHGESTIDEERKWLGYIKDEAERLSELTNSLLYLARLDYSAAEKTEPAKVSFSQAAESVILVSEAVIYEKNINFSENVEDDIFIKGDEGQIKQLVVILLDNAMKYVSEDGEIRLELKKSGGKARLTVSNTYSGELEETKVFDRFYRADKSRARSSGGYGLGLAIAKSITDLHKGTITLSGSGGCAVFTVEIPAL